jgi:vesicle coat complex subunit
MSTSPLRVAVLNWCDGSSSWCHSKTLLHLLSLKVLSDPKLIPAALSSLMPCDEEAPMLLAASPTRRATCRCGPQRATECSRLVLLPLLIH